MRTPRSRFCARWTPVGTWLADYHQEIDPDGIAVNELLKMVQADTDPRLTSIGLGKKIARSGLYRER